MNKIKAMAALALFLAVPAYGDVEIAGGPELGLGSQESGAECVLIGIVPDECIRENSSDSVGSEFKAANLPSGISISGEASMGVVYDGENFEIQDDVTIHIQFSTSPRNGFSAGSKLSLESQ